ncbi:MAG TPA: HDOD domain-containing protein [Pseudomonadales bacterium]|nr:HDOD domain-containing protein [Pseudomonadales bacterium]
MTAIALVQKVKDLPPVSHTALKLINLLDKPSADNDEIVQVLTYDNVLTAKLLRACNSPAYGLEESVSSVDQAVVLLGHKQILHIVMTLAFGSVMTVSSVTYTMELNELWEHSLVSAFAAEIVRDDVPELDGQANVAFTACLLHDIGKLILALALAPEQISEIRDRIERKQISGSQAEKEVLGLDHGDVGAALLRSWRLPENIVEAVANHHRPKVDREPRLSALVHIANVVAHYAKPPVGQNAYDLQIDPAVASSFGIDANKLEKMTGAAQKSFEQVECFLQMA